MLASFLYSLSIGAVGGALFAWLNTPLPWMLGPLVFNLIAAMSRQPVAVPERARLYFLGVLGLVLGSHVTAEMGMRMLQWPVSAALLLIGVAASTMLCAWWLRRRGFDPVSAWFSAAPGAMTAMIMMGEASGGDPRKIALSQSLRIVLILLILPPLFWWMADSATVATETSSKTGSQFSAAWLLLTIPPLIALGKKTKLPTPALLLPLGVSSSLSLFEVARFDVPGWGLNLMLLVLGSSIGARFRGLSLQALRAHMADSVVATLLALGVMAAIAEVLHLTMGTPYDVALMAMAPGGIGELAILAVALHLDPVFVAFHHMLRVVALMGAAPLIARQLNRRAERMTRNDGG